MNTYLLVYLCLLVVEALLGIILKYSGRVDPWHGEPWYNPHTPQEIESGLVSVALFVLPAKAFNAKGTACT